MEINETSIFPDRPAPYATFWARFAAAFIDGLIVSVATWTLYFIIDSEIIRFVINLCIGWLYSALMLSGPRQATLGKRAMGIIVTSTYGQRISFAQASGRYFGTLLSTLILCIGYLMMLWDDKKQTLHDKLAGTIVVTASPQVIS
ncbi:MAG: RDD family protein [Bacteroidota bacterium]